MEDHGNYTNRSGLERSLVLLAQLRASQLNACAYCIESVRGLKAVPTTLPFL